MTTATWHLKGDFLELCNCDVACPCVMNEYPVAPTEGYCDGGFTWHIEDGAFDGVKLDGLNFAFFHHAPGKMNDGDWTSAVYIDSRADEGQRAALAQILSGDQGGPMANYMAMTGNFLGIQYVPIEYKRDGNARSVSIEGVTDYAVDALVKSGFETPIRLDSVRGWVPWMNLARGVTGSYTDRGLQFENAGKNGFCGPFAWPKA